MSWYEVAGSQNPMSWTNTVTVSSTCHAELSRQNRSHQLAKDGVQGIIETSFDMKDVIPSTAWDIGKECCERAGCRGMGSIFRILLVLRDTKLHLFSSTRFSFPSSVRKSA